MKIERWTFFGKILPDRVPLTWGAPLEGNARVEDAYSFSCNYRISLHLGQLVIDATFEAAELDLGTMRNFIQEQAEHLVAFVGYKAGGMFDVEIISASRQETDEWCVFGNEWQCLVDQRPDRFAPLQADDVKLILEDSFSGPILSDFQRAMREDTGFYCYRAVETMMQSLRSETVKDAEAWKKLRDSLSLDRSLIDRLKYFADPVRHGKRKGMSGKQREEIVLATDLIIARYLGYLLGGRKPLNATEFPLLKHAG